MTELTSTTPFAHTLVSAGLKESDAHAVRTLATELAAAGYTGVHSFGRDAQLHTAEYADKLLDEVRNSDLEKSGKLLSDVVVTAKSLNVNALSSKRSRIPVIGKIVDRFRVSQARVMQQFASTREQVDTLLSEVAQTQEGLDQRIASLEDMHGLVQAEYRQLGLYIAAGELCAAEMRTGEAQTPPRDDPAGAVAREDLLHRIAAIEKRVGDLRVLQQSALQTLPMIRMIQGNNSMLVEKFHAIRELTIPAWKRQFMLALSLNEQQSAANLSGTIDDATNEFFKRNAELLHTNAVATAKSNQRLVIDVDTLEKVQASLIATVEDVVRIHKDGQRERQQVEGRITGMREQLVARLGGPESQEDVRTLQ